jgi:tetratricopeptide (TPR) repeat protein
MKLSVLAEKLNNDPVNPDNLKEFSQLLIERKEFASALVVLKFLYKIEPSVINLIVMCNAFIKTGLAANINIAISLIDNELNNLKNTQVELFELRKLIGNAYTHIGNFDQAKMYYESCLRMNREQDVIFTNLGILYYTQKMYDQARDSFESALNFKMDNSAALAGLGMTLMNTGHPGLAMIRLNQALDYDPVNTSAVNALVTLVCKSGNVELALNRLKNYLEHDPMNVDIIYSYAAMEYQSGNPEIARTELEKALLINPEHQYSNELMGIILNPVTGIANKELESRI